MGKPSTPPAPDYIGAAKQQGEENINAAIAAQLTQPSQITPFGQTRIGTTGQNFTLPGGQVIPGLQQTTTLSPAEQQKLEQTQGIQSSLLGRAQETLGQPYQAGNINQMQDVAEQAILSRLEPQLSRARDQRETALTTRGHAPGGESWKAAQEGLAFQETDARRQSILDALKIRPQLIQEEQAVRGMPLAELAALSNSQSVNIPQFSGGGGHQIGASPIFGATGQQANAANQIYNVESSNAAGTQQAAMATAATIIAAMI